MAAATALVLLLASSAAAATVLPMWKDTCNKVDAKCADTWNATVGKARGMKIN